MSQNDNILGAKKKFTVILCVFLFVQICFLFAVNIIINRFFTELQLEEGLKPIINTVAYCVIITLSLIVDYFFALRIIKLQKLSQVEPLLCDVEDIIVYHHKVKSGIKYKAYLVVREKQSGKLLFTYGRYSNSFYNYTIVGANKSLVSANIFRKDGSVVKIGDTVKVYKNKSVDVKVQIKNNEIKLNNKKFPFYNTNSEYGKDAFAGIDFFEGAVDVEV